MEDKTMSDKINQWLYELEQFASSGELLISNSKSEHFSNVVEIMKLVGAERQGSKNITGSDGIIYLVDIYNLPSGSKVFAGFKNPYI